MTGNSHFVDPRFTSRPPAPLLLTDQRTDWQRRIDTARTTFSFAHHDEAELRANFERNYAKMREWVAKHPIEIITAKAPLRRGDEGFEEQRLSYRRQAESSEIAQIAGMVMGLDPAPGQDISVITVHKGRQIEGRVGRASFRYPTDLEWTIGGKTIVVPKEQIDEVIDKASGKRTGYSMGAIVVSQDELADSIERQKEADRMLALRGDAE